MKFIEWHKRSIAKIVSWRFVITAANFGYTFAVTGDWRAGLAVAGIAAIFNSIIYYLHERAWNVISWGKEVKEN
jgi:uncharacterized membrane protein